MIDGLFRLVIQLRTRCGSAAATPQSRRWRHGDISRLPRRRTPSGPAITSERVDATLRRAALLAGPLNQLGDGCHRAGRSTLPSRCEPRDDFRVGLALVELYEHDLRTPGRAMAELRRLIDRYPTAQGVRRLRVALAELKSERFADARS